jgi:hypothetical protein
MGSYFLVKFVMNFLYWAKFEGLSTRDQTIPPVICHTYSFPVKRLAKEYANPPARNIQ